MRYWWVNQNQTFDQEQRGGYLWSPKRKSNGQRNRFYDTMREVAPGDLVLSFQGQLIRSIGIVRSYCYESPKPPEFGSAGPNWSQIGWRVEVGWVPPNERVRVGEFSSGQRHYLDYHRNEIFLATAHRRSASAVTSPPTPPPAPSGRDHSGAVA